MASNNVKNDSASAKAERQDDSVQNEGNFDSKGGRDEVMRDRDEAKRGDEHKEHSEHVEVTVARGRTVVHDRKVHGPGARLKVHRDDAEMLRQGGFTESAKPSSLPERIESNRAVVRPR